MRPRSLFSRVLRALGARPLGDQKFGKRFRHGLAPRDRPAPTDPPVSTSEAAGPPESLQNKGFPEFPRIGEIQKTGVPHFDGTYWHVPGIHGVWDPTDRVPNDIAAIVKAHQEAV
jgi:hypothetical protein